MMNKKKQKKNVVANKSFEEWIKENVALVYPLIIRQSSSEGLCSCNAFSTANKSFEEWLKEKVEKYYGNTNWGQWRKEDDKDNG